MAGIARLALIPVTLAAAALPAVAQADAGAATQPSAALLGSVGRMPLYPLAGSQLDPLSNSLDATVAGVPLNTVGVSQIFSDGLPIRDLPGYAQVQDANAEAEAAGGAMLANDGNEVHSALAH